MNVATNPPPLFFQGPQEAFAEIVRKNQNLVYATVFSILGCPQQSEDIAQETFLVAWKNYGSLQSEEKLSAWLCGIARNLSRKWLRDNCKKTQPLTDEIAEPSQNNDDFDQLSRNEAANLVWNSLKHLSEKYREPIMMFYQKQNSVKEIATALEISEDSVKQRLSRGRRQLKKIVEQEFSNALEVLCPRETFCLAVLAAIPFTASTTKVLAATGAVVAGKSTTSTTGGAAFTGVSTGVFVTLIYVFLAYVCLFLGINRVLQNSPTIRSRRLMIQAVLLHTITIISALCIIATITKHIPTERTAESIVLNISFLFGAFFLVGYTFFTCTYFNRRWRQVVEEDTGLRPTSKIDLEESDLSQKKLRNQIIATFGLILLYCIGSLIYDAITGGYYFGGTDALILKIGMFLLGILPYAALLLVVISMFQTTKDEETFQRNPAKNLEILDYLTGKLQNKRRTYFLIDICIMYHTLLCFCWFGMGIPNDWFRETEMLMTGPAYVCNLLQFLFFVSWIWQLVRYAGIPRKRYWGFAIFGTAQFVFFWMIMLISHWHLSGKVDAANFNSFFVSLCMFASSPYIAMALAGIIGLWIFQKTHVTPKPF